MQQELRNDYPEHAISILGINDRASEIGNPSITDGRDLPWLQDTDQNQDLISDVWDLWDATERDVIILDGNNVEAARFNLTQNDLGEAEHYESLRDLFVEIASLEDTETDPSLISGKVFVDLNNDGLQDQHESAIGNVLVSLEGYTDQGQLVQLSQTTEANGEYAFQGLSPGSYTVTQHQPTFLLDGLESVGSAGGEVREDQFVIQLSEGVHATGYDFCELGRTAQSISLADVLVSSDSQNGMLATVEPSTGEHWFTLHNQWKEFQFAEVRLNPDSSSITVVARDTHGHSFQGHFTTNHSARILASDAQHTLMQFVGSLTDLTAAEQAASNSEADDVAEGEPLEFVSSAFNLPPTAPPIDDTQGSGEASRENSVDVVFADDDWDPHAPLDELF